MPLSSEPISHGPEQPFKNCGRASGIGIGQIGFARLAIDSKVDQLAETASQAVANLTQGIGMRQLAEQHGRQLSPASEALGMTLTLVLFNQGGEFVSRNLFEKLTE